MSLDLSKFETLTPSQFITFTIPNLVSHHCWLHTPLLRVAVLDSPIAVTPSDDLPLVAAMIVPNHRETDWNFSTESGHLQVLFNFNQISRLILIGNCLPHNPEPTIYIRPPVIDAMDKDKLEAELKPLVLALHPKLCFKNGLPETVFLTYEDDLTYRVIIDRFVGPVVGEFLVEDVEVQTYGDNNKEFRRRLRFKRMPNLIQSDVLLIPRINECEGNMGLDLESLRKINNVEFHVNTKVLVHSYLTTMVAGLFLIVSSLNEQIQLGFTPRALCLGVGGGALLSFLNTQLGFEAVGVEADEVVLNVARQYFGLNDGKFVRLVVGDAIELIEKTGSRGTEGNKDKDDSHDGLDARFDVVMVDLDSSEASSGISAPPLEFVRKSVFQAVRLLLLDHGVLIINAVPLNNEFYLTLVQELKAVFHKVYEIDVGNEGNFVLVATMSQVASDNNDNAFSAKLRSVISRTYMDTIMEL